MRMHKEIHLFSSAAALLLIAAIALTFSGCAKKEQQRSYRVGVIAYSQNDAFISEVVEAYRKEIEDMQGSGRKIRIRVRYAALSQRKENSQVKELLEEGCDLLCVNLVERTNPSTIIHAAIEKDVPIIFFNREPVQEDLNRSSRLYYIGTNARQSGELQGKMAADLFRNDETVDKNHDGQLQYVILEGEPGHQDAIIRTDQVVETLTAENITLDKLGYQIANWSRSQAENRMNQMISKYQYNIEMVLANNDDMALGAADAYDKLNVTAAGRPVILGIDGTKDGIDAVREGKIAGTVCSDTGEFARKMADMTNRILRGQSLEELNLEDGKRLYLQYREVTAENAYP